MGWLDTCAVATEVIRNQMLVLEVTIFQHGVTRSIYFLALPAEPAVAILRYIASPDPAFIAKN